MPRAPPVTIAVLPSSMPIGASPCRALARAAITGQTLAPKAIKRNARREAMRAVGYKRSLPIDQAESLIDIEIDKPVPQGRDLLVEVKAISVNPVDTKVRMRAAPKD